MSYRAWATIIIVVLLIIIGFMAFLQNSGSPRPETYEDIGTELGSGRIEQPAAAIAITTPPGWSAWEPSTDFQDWWGATQVVALWTEPARDTETWWMGDCDIGEVCGRARMVEAGGEAYCWIMDDTELAAQGEWAGPETPADVMSSGLSEQDGWSGISTTAATLPAGEASRIVAVDPNGWDQTIYHVTDGERWVRLICGVLDGDFDPASIAQTIEFLP